MELKELVSSLEPSKELKKLGVKQDSYFCWEPDTRLCFESDRFILGGAVLPSRLKYCYSAYTFAELLEKLPGRITTAERDDYFLLVTRTKKTKWFVLPDYYIGYKTLDDRYLRSERAETMADAAAKMVIYLIKEGIIEVKKDV